MEISPQEEYLIKVLRELRPYEVVEIHKDKLGKAETFLVKRSQKIIVGQVANVYVK